MKRIGVILLLAAWLAPAASAQQVVDRIVARIGNGVITQSQVTELGRFQLLVDGKQQPGPRRLHELADQWIVRREAALNGFPAPGARQIESALAGLEKRFGSPAAFEKRLKAVGLTRSETRALLGREILLNRYLDYKFRPQVQIDEQEIETYYRDTLTPELRKMGQRVPSMGTVADQVREVLVQRGVTERAGRWLDQMQRQWKVEPVEDARNPSE